MNNKLVFLFYTLFFLICFSACNPNEISSGLYYGTEHTPIIKVYKESTCQEEGYEIIGCAACDEIFEEKKLPIVDCNFVDGFCEWCGNEGVDKE